jgi:hypothetical protein
VPELRSGTVVILDNLATHRNVVAADALRQAGCWFLYLPQPLQTSSKPSATSAICSRSMNVGNSSRLLDMSLVKAETLLNDHSFVNAQCKVSRLFHHLLDVECQIVELGNDMD